jgi:hypothetical protein
LQTLRTRRGQLIAASIVWVYFLVVAVGGRATWERLRVPVERPAFFDLRSLTSAWECEREGIDVLPVNPCDPRRRPANYPRLWLVVAPLGLDESDTVALGVALAVLFFALALAVTGPLTAYEGLLYGIALVSPAVMFGVERGNPDLFVFALLAGALLTFRGGVAARVLSHCLLLLAAMLKLFPFFAWGLLARQRRAATIGLAMLLAFGVYVAAVFEELRVILEVVPREIGQSYGAGVLADGLVDALDLTSGSAPAISIALVVFGALVAISLGRRWRSRVSVSPSDRRLDALWVGGGIYVGSYAVMHNYDYRLLFLLLAIPQLLRWIREPDGGMPFAGLGLAALMTSLLFAARLVYDLAPEEVVNWFLFVYLAAVLVATFDPRAAGTRSAGRMITG